MVVQAGTCAIWPFLDLLECKQEYKFPEDLLLTCTPIRDICLFSDSSENGGECYWIVDQFKFVPDPHIVCYNLRNTHGQCGAHTIFNRYDGAIWRLWDEIRPSTCYLESEHGFYVSKYYFVAADRPGINLRIRREDYYNRTETRIIASRIKFNGYAVLLSPVLDLADVFVRWLLAARPTALDRQLVQEVYLRRKKVHW